MKNKTKSQIITKTPVKTETVVLRNSTKKIVDTPDDKTAPKRTTTFAQDVLNSGASKVVAKKADKIVGKIYRDINNKKKPEKTFKGKQKNKKYAQGFTQSLIPIRRISYGIIQTTSGQYVKILEILPIDYYTLAPQEKNQVISNYERIFRSASSEVHLKVISDTNNPTRLISYIKNRCEEEAQRGTATRAMLECAQDRINHINKLSNSKSLSKRFFLIYKYEGHSSDFNEIYSDLETMKIHYCAVFKTVGNTVIDFDTFKEDTFETADILYYFFNRNTYREEPLQSRIDRTVQDCTQYNRSVGKKLDVFDSDFIAPKGAKFISNNYIEIDGTYKTYIALSDDGHPSGGEAGWIDQFTNLNGAELDIYIRKLNREYVRRILEQKNRLDFHTAKESYNNPTRQNEIMEKVHNVSFITQSMAQGEDLFDVVIIITISASSIRELRIKRASIEKELTSKRYRIENAWQYTQEYFKATMPLMEMPSSLFSRNKHNYLTSSLKSLYPFTAFEMYDPTGFVLGRNNRFDSIVSVNPFNTKNYTNANQLILGVSGSGKTFTSEIIARSMRVTGIRTLFVLPVKGYEYRRGCEAISGSYIQIGPGQHDCINICAIMPEQDIDKNLLSDSIVYNQTSQLASKISFLITWIQLLDPKKELDTPTISLMSSALFDMYEQFNISEDNDSIWESPGVLKPMPRISDIYNVFMQYSNLEPIAALLLDYISGPFKNFNGQTNIDLSNKYIVFDVDEEKMAKKYLPACLFIALNCCYSLVKQNLLSRDMVFFDEAWKMLANDAAAEQLLEMVKLIRGFGGGVTIATQELNDFISSKVGLSILNNTATKLLLKLDETNCDLVTKYIHLSADEENFLTTCGKGQGLYMTGKNRVFVNIDPSEKEVRDFTTDRNLLAKYAKEEALKARRNASSNS